MASWKRQGQRGAHRRGGYLWLVLLGIAISEVPTIPASAAVPPPVTLLSRADPAVVADTGGGTSSLPPVSAISADGRYVVFTSDASNLVPGQVSPHITFQVFLFVEDFVAGGCTRRATARRAAGRSNARAR